VRGGGRHFYTIIGEDFIKNFKRKSQTLGECQIKGINVKAGIVCGGSSFLYQYWRGFNLKVREGVSKCGEMTN